MHLARRLRPQDGKTALEVAASDAVRVLLDGGKELVKAARADRLVGALHRSVTAGDTAAARALLERGADPNGLHREVRAASQAVMSLTVQCANRYLSGQQLEEQEVEARIGCTAAAQNPPAERRLSPARRGGPRPGADPP